MDKENQLKPRTYDWCVRAFDRVRNLLGVRIKLHHEHGQIEQGDIFLFNHFARMETFIPQYLIYKETGAFCRSIAAAAFFRGNDRFTQVLYDLGAVPSDLPDLMPTLAGDILKGRKIVIFPEGGMVKDRQVLDENGEYSVYSRSAESRRKHHTGAARLAIGLQIIKLRILEAETHGNRELLRRWTAELDMPSVEALLTSARRPVKIVPANITFYPLRVRDNFLRRSAETLNGKLSARAVEELIIEGNLFFKSTDMDIRLGDAICPLESWAWWERMLATYLARRLDDANDIYDGEYLRRNRVRRTATKGLRASISRLRNRYMRDIYREVTVNTSHLASHAVLKSIENKSNRLALDEIKKVIYLAIKKLQGDQSVHLHRSICNPSVYSKLLGGDTPELIQFFESAVNAELLEIRPEELVFAEKLALEHEFDSVRLENPIEVYANEIEPIKSVGAAVETAILEIGTLPPERWSRLRFDDELISYEWDKSIYRAKMHEEINRRETATADPRPFLLEPKFDNAAQPTQRIGVLLVHGFLASPAEVRSFGDKLCAAGYVVLGVRLKGHGTSPWDLRNRSWQDWYDSVDSGLTTLQGLVDTSCVVGFSTGGALALLLSARRAQDVHAVAAVCTPFKFRNKNMRFVPFMHGANKIVRWLSKYEGVMPFRPNESEHPDINYRNMPIRGLYELTRLVAAVSEELAAVRCPVSIVQADQDRVVDPASASIAYATIGSQEKVLHLVESERHGILNEDIGGTHDILLQFLDSAVAELTPAELAIKE